MKPHIAQTLADLRAEAEQLNTLITVLERYGAETAPAAPVPPVQCPQKPAAAAAPPPARRRTSPVSRDPGTVGAKLLVCDAIAHIPEPFNCADVREWCAANRKADSKKVGKSSWFTSLIGLTKRGEIAEHPPGRNGKIAWVKTAGFGKPTPAAVKASKLPEREAAYRALRDSMNINTPDE